MCLRCAPLPNPLKALLGNERSGEGAGGPGPAHCERAAALSQCSSSCVISLQHTHTMANFFFKQVQAVKSFHS